nr:hypothetical protein [Tanacetum cinerariifolium]
HTSTTKLPIASPPNSPIAKTPSPMSTSQSPSPPNAPTKTLSSMEELSYSTPSPPRETSSPFSPYSPSQPINAYIQDLLDVPPRTPHALPHQQEPTPMETQVILSLNKSTRLLPRFTLKPTIP